MKHRFKKWMVGIGLSLVLCLTGNAWLMPAPAHAADAASSLADHIIWLGQRFMGTPYKYGAQTGNTSSFDCSSFVQYLYRENGISLPRDSKSQSGSGNYIPRNQLQPGDLVFFYSPIHHVAIYIGNGQILHAYGEPGVTISKLNTGWWNDHYATARRVIPNLGQSSGSVGGSAGSGTAGRVPEGDYPTGWIQKSVNFRTAPTVNSSRIRYLQAGETVRILEKLNNQWYKVQDYKGQIGYLTTLQQYVQYHSKPGGDGPAANPTAYPSGLILKGVNFRTQPSVNSGQVIRLLKKGETVRILSKENQHWYKIQDKNGQIGYLTTISGYMKLN